MPQTYLHQSKAIKNKKVSFSGCWKMSSRLVSGMPSSRLPFSGIFPKEPESVQINLFPLDAKDQIGICFDNLKGFLDEVHGGAGIVLRYKENKNW